VNPLFKAAADLQQFARDNGWRSAVIGGLAVQRWGEPRQTRDVDVALLTGFGGEERFVDRLLERYAPRRPDARQFAIERRVLLIEDDHGIPLDVSLAALPFEERVIERSTPFPFAPGTAIGTCSAEDLVVLKAFADRPQDWLDIEGIVVRQGRALDRALILGELDDLLALKEDASPRATLDKIFHRHTRD
jgi:hypothetical protein